jgi:GTP pyrophosphokinase
MNKDAEYGVCAHWSYKEKIDLKKEGHDFEWMKDAADFWNSFKIDFFPNKIFCFTPKGDVIILPKNSTAVDFAYAVHSDIGNHCESAKIEGKIVPLAHVLENGDIVEITTNKNKSPSKDWLRFVVTSLAKSNIKKLTDGEKLGFKLPFSGFIRRKLAEISEASKKKREEKIKLSKDNVRHISIAGHKGMLVHVAKCCNPQPGDKVSAYLAPNRATVLHKTSCENFKKIAERFPEKIIDASWK